MAKRQLDEEEEVDNPMKRRDSQQEEDEEEAAKPIGRAIRITQDDDGIKKHYNSFQMGSNVFELGDTVLVSPAEGKKPYIAIIKDVIVDTHDSVIATGQWFYRPEEAEKVGGGYWEAIDSRELFYSFHLDEIPAESIMHRCVVHFVPLHKRLPLRSQNPGFIVQKVYDIDKKMLWKLVDRDYENDKQQEIDMLVEKTRQRLGYLPDILLEDFSAKQTHWLKSKNLVRNNMHPIDHSRVEPTTRLAKLTKAYVTSRSDVSKYHVILAKFKVLTGEPSRDKWLEKLLQGIQLVCISKVAKPMDDKHSDFRKAGENNAPCTGSYRSDSDAGARICWPDSVIPLITRLERVTHEALGIDYQKYNQKMRQLDFNLKNNALLAKRLLNKELEPIALLAMTPDELKEGLTADERITIDPEETEQMQMFDIRCSRCMEKKVGLRDIISAGGPRNRYQLECLACGHTWYASPDIISSLTVDPSLPM